MSQFSNNFVIEDLIYIPMGNYNPMLSRPYTVNTSMSALETIQERLSETRSGKVTTNIVNGVAGEIIQPSAVGYQSLVDSNWVGNKKYIFMLKVSTVDPFGATICSYIQGYTEYDGITQTGNIDNNLVHYINNVIETMPIVLNTPLGIIRKEKLYKIYNVFFNSGQNDIYTQRPSDVLENIKLLDMNSVVDSYSSIYLGNYINPIDRKTIGSSVDNTITTDYLSKILTYGIHNAKDKDLFINSYETVDRDSPQKALPEPSISDNRFLKYLSRSSGFNTVREVFNFGSLMGIDPTIYNRFKVLNITKNYVDPTMAQTPDVGDYWHGQDPVTIKAYSLIENSVALATKYGFNKIYFTASNMTSVTGQCEVFITNFNSFINLDEQDFSYLLELFKDKFINEIFINETAAGVIPMHLDAYIDLLGTSKINLSYAGYQANWYTIPTFANSLFSSMVLVDKTALDYGCFEIGNMINTLADQCNQNRTFY